ncbi:DUF4344 domain-containing metallopeptidase [Longimicrobium sp.]|jgi:hypothetical protein|uniref:DUF4344 domain-containing metallopeptidase n=1 Tax=Longimicrobium sp. TaxID=2029185 RepID=UPI002ED7B44C
MISSKSLLALAAGLALSSAPAAAQGRWIAAYAPAQDPLTAALGASLQQWGMLESMLEPLNRDMQLPRDITVELAECGTPSATYDPGRPAIRLCYELFNQLMAYSTARGDSSAALFGRAFNLIFLHQAGHALIDLLKLQPGVPLEEAADQFAVINTTGFGDPERWVDAAAALHQHAVDWEHPGSGETALYFGSDPDAFGAPAGKGRPRPAGAANCKHEYDAVLTAWVTMLEPYLRN